MISKHWLSVDLIGKYQGIDPQIPDHPFHDHFVSGSGGLGTGLARSSVIAPSLITLWPPGTNRFVEFESWFKCCALECSSLAEVFLLSEPGMVQVCSVVGQNLHEEFSNL